MTAPVYLVVFRSRATEQFTAPPINWRWVQKHSQTVHRTSIGPKRLHPDTHRLQIHWPGIHITAERPQKSGQGPQNSSQHHQWIGGGFQKHSHTVHGTSIYQKDFSLTPIDYKSNDLEYTLQQKDLKKAVKGHGMAHSTTNKLEVGSKTLTDCAQDIHWPNAFHPDTHRLQTHWPGIHITAKRLQRKKAPECRVLPKA